jgi:hypothetical protein
LECDELVKIEAVEVALSIDFDCAKPGDGMPAEDCD